MPERLTTLIPVQSGFLVKLQDAGGDAEIHHPPNSFSLFFLEWNILDKIF